MAETAPVTSYAPSGKKKRHPMSRPKPAKTVFKKRKATTGGTKHGSDGISTSGG